MKRILLTLAIILTGILAYGQKISTLVSSGDTVSTLTNDSYFSFSELDGTPSTVAIRLNPLLSSISGWLKTGTNLSPTTSGDDLLLGTTELIYFGDGDTYIGQPGDDELDIVVNSGPVISFTGSGTRLDDHIIGYDNKVINLGSTVNYFDNAYVDRLYVDTVVSYVDVTAGVMSLTDTTGTYAIRDIGVKYAADAQADDDYEVDIPEISALTAGLTVTFLANTANTDGATLEITSVGDIDAILKLHDQALVTGDIEAGQIVTVVFDGTNWQMTSQLAQ